MCQRRNHELASELKAQKCKQKKEAGLMQNQNGKFAISWQGLPELGRPSESGKARVLLPDTLDRGSLHTQPAKKNGHRMIGRACSALLENLKRAFRWRKLEPREAHKSSTKRRAFSVVASGLCKLSRIVLWL